MSLLIPIDQTGSIVNNGWPAIKEFDKLVKKHGEKALKVCILCYDSYSMYRRMKEDMREDRLMKNEFGKEWKKIFESVEFQEAKFLYKSIDYDELYDSRDVYSNKLREINTVIANMEFTPENSSQIQSYTNLQKTVMAQLDSVNQKIVARGQEKKDLQTVVLSGIERFYLRAEKMKTENMLFRNKRTQPLVEKKEEVLKEEIPEAQQKDFMD